MESQDSAAKYISVIFIRTIIAFFLVHMPLASAAKTAFPECECPEVGCNTDCEVQVDLSFYSEKCGKGGTKVRSCAKPKCVPQNPLPKKCENLAAYKNLNRVFASKKPQSKKEVTFNGHSKNKTVANVMDVEGKAWLHRLGSKKIAVKKGQALKEQDLLLTGAKGKIQFQFKDGNIVNLTPNTEMKIASYLSEKKEDKRQTVLDLIKGRVRNKVKQKYKGANYYKVRTKAAVAGVRGTDFVVSYFEGKKSETKVETITGKVELSDHKETTKREIDATQYASYVVDSPPSGVFDKSDMESFVARGYLTPVYKMSSEEVQKLDWDTELAANRHMPEKKQVLNTAKAEFICAAPKAQLNQCSWVCKNNPKGAKSCRTDLPQVQCVRKRCNANGKWSSETRLPASFGQNCEANKPVVNDCDY